METILHVLDIQSMILAQRVMVLKRFTNKDNNSSWKITLNYFLSQVGGEFILKCHFDLISDTGIFLKSVKVLHTNLSPILTTFQVDERRGRVLLDKALNISFLIQMT